MYSAGLIPLVVAFFVAFTITPLTIRVAHLRGWVDKPGGRKIHRKPIPRLGGFGVFLALWAGWFLFAFLQPDRVPYEARSQVNALFFSSTLVWFLGLYDDLKGANAWQKLIVQIVAAAFVAKAGIQVRILFNPFAGGDVFVSSDFWSWALSVGWIVFVSNAINLIDGLDGLAGGVCCITALSIYFIARELGSPHLPFLALAVAGACAGFLFFNFSPARIFLGDGGALPLGFLLACLSLMGATKRSTAIVMFGPPIILALPLADSFLAIARRLLRGSMGSWTPGRILARLKEVLQADQEHIHHGLLKIGLSHRRAVILLYGVTSVLGITAYRHSVGNHLISTLVTFVVLAAALAWLRRRAKRN
jgi:UDP-GlcNAc:undecaprenyl-phosphate GlcNAc-1-phosphate transferase